MKLEEYNTRLENGDRLVPVFKDVNGDNCTKFGDTYSLNYLSYKVTEVCKKDLKGFCWIARDK